MLEPDQQRTPLRKVAGCFTSLLIGVVAFVALLLGVCVVNYGRFLIEDAFFQDPDLFAIVAAAVIAGIILLILAIRFWRRR